MLLSKQYSFYSFIDTFGSSHLKVGGLGLNLSFEINGVIAVLAAVLVYGGVHLIGLTANHEMRTLFLIIASLTFMSYGNRVNDME